ncbi:MAG TPA: L-aspartate oxidase [Azospirillaceae bacterium]|nr:L-aspartate oxidase [Azospirillaceae bacterium]
MRQARGYPNGVPVSPVDVSNAGTIVVGSGIAGLTAALRLSPRPVTLLTKTADLPGGSTLWAQGGVAVALGEGDSAEAHAADTVAAGAGLVDPRVAALLTSAGIERVVELLLDGLPADRGGDGEILLGREAAHGRDRILHAGGDATGRTLVAHLAERVRRQPTIRVETEATAWDLVVARGRVAGVLAHHRDRGWVFHRAGDVVLATGGTGQLWSVTTNPAESTADGLALAARAGAHLADLEFVQFHPTALAGAADGRGIAQGARRPLLTEALRGAGARLLDGEGRRFMPAEHPLAELAPRDVVARAIGRRVASGEPVFLDLRAVWAEGGAARFPTVSAICAEAGLDPAVQPIPVAPAAHYHMGGVATDTDGRTSVEGLWACGEVAATGAHGANRLASNSLLEALVFGDRVASAIAARPQAAPPVPVPDAPRVAGAPMAPALAAEAQRLMARHVGLVRDGEGLVAATSGLARLERLAEDLGAGPAADGHDDIRAAGELRNRLLASRLIAAAALRRQESRGAHFRADFPEASEGWRRRLVTSAEALAGIPQDGAHIQDNAGRPLALPAE